MSHFVAAGTDPSDAPGKDDDAWAKARATIEATKKPKPEVGRQEDGKSLYDVLQANKAAKQAEFEESARLSNQFRSLDNDDVDFLDGVLQAERHKEEAVKKENAEQLEVFRKQQNFASLDTTDTQVIRDEEVAAWSTRKRRRKDADPRVIKLRKTSTGEDRKDSDAKKEPTIVPASRDGQILKSAAVQNTSSTSRSPSKPASLSAIEAPPSLGLEGYSSDED